jgi:hypothetical protein
MEQRVNVNFFVKMQKSPSETLEILKTVYSESIMNKNDDFKLPKKPRMSKPKIKTMFICFLDIRGTIHFEFVPEGITVNQKF